MAVDVTPPQTVRGIVLLLALLVVAVAALYLSLSALIVFAIVLFVVVAVGYALGVRFIDRLSGGSW